MLRAVVIAAIVAVVVVGVVVAVHYSAQHQGEEQKAVAVRAAYTKTECSAANPVKVTLENHSDRTLKAYSFDLDVYLDGDSTNLSGVDAPQTWTKIVAPHATASTCVPLPREAKDRIAHSSGRRAYTVRAEGHVASFYDEGEYIPPEAPSASASAHR